MRRDRRFCASRRALRPVTILSLVLVVFVLLAAGRALAQQGDQVPGSGYDLAWWTVNSGGGLSSGPGYSLGGTLGQPDAGLLSGPGYTLAGGFWPGRPGGAGKYRVYLPLAVRSYP